MTDKIRAVLRALIESSGGRKFLIGCAVCAAIITSADVLLYLSKITGDQWVESLHVVKWVVGIVAGLNVAQKALVKGGDE